MRSYLFVVVATVAMALSTPSFAAKHCWTQCRQDGSGICDTFCD
jgi:hypothetical protein